MRPKNLKSRLYSILACAIFILVRVFLLYAEDKRVPEGQCKVYKNVYPNKSLIQSAWDCHNEKEYDNALPYIEKCIALYDEKAKQLQASLTSPIPRDKINQYWMLNDVATAKFIKGRILYLKGNKKEARELFSDVIHNYSYAMSYDLRGWYWSISDAARDMLKAIDMGIDFGDSSSSFLTSKAWESYGKKDYKSAIGYAQQCINKYKETALRQQNSLSQYPKKEDIKKYWALNDVGTCYFIAGKSYPKLGDKAKGREYLSFIKSNLKFASCWDTHGWYWRVADALKNRQ